MENEEVKPKEKEVKSTGTSGYMVSMNGITAMISIAGKEFTDDQKAKIASECSSAGIALLQKINKSLS